MLTILTLLLQPAAGGGAVVGSKAINFTLKTFQGKPVTLSKLRGKVVLLDFWASWCDPCREEMPFLDILQKKYGPRGFTVLAVNIDNSSKNALAFLQQYNIKLPSLWDKKKKVVSAYDVQAMPTTLIIDQRGWVRFIHHGFKAEKFPVYKRQIEMLLLQGRADSLSKRSRKTRGVPR